MSSRLVPQVRLSRDFWSRNDVLRALSERNFGELFRLVCKYGASQTQIAIAVGMTQGQVSTIIAGARRVTAIDVAERALEGLRAPDHARTRFGLAPRRDAGAAQQLGALTAHEWTTQSIDEEAAAGSDAVLPGSPDIESAEEVLARARRLRRSNVDEPRLAYLERAADSALLTSERRAPTELLPVVRDLRRWVDTLLAGGQHPAQRERLYVTAVKLSGLLGSLALDLGRWQVARAYGVEAYELAEFLDRPDLQSWARATQSLIEYYAGNYHDALAFAQDGQRIARGGPQSVRLALNGEARALARLGDSAGVDEAVDRGFHLLAGQAQPEGVSVSLALDTYCEARAAANAATAYLIIKRPGPVHLHAATALTAFDAAGLRGPQALSRLDQATAWLMGEQPDPERGCEVLRSALSYVTSDPPQSVVQRSREFVRSARTWGELPAVREAAELVGSFAARPALPSGAFYDLEHGDS